MREIKFRAFDRSTKEMKLPTLLRLGRGLPFTDDNNNGKVYQCQCNGEENIEYFGLGGEDTQIILMQFTGLKDKNGKEIYEGDILLIGEEEHNLPELVIFKNGCFCIKASWLKNKDDDSVALHYYCNKIFINTVELAGNIYENPELLEDK